MKYFLFITLSIAQFTFAGECAFSTAPVVILKVDHELHQTWSEENKTVFYSNTMPTAMSFSKYRTSIKENLSNIAPDFLLRKQYNDFLNSGLPDLVAEAPNMITALDRRYAAFHSSH